MALAQIYTRLLHLFSIPYYKLIHQINLLYNFDLVKDNENTLPPIQYSHLPAICSKWNINWQYLFPAAFLCAAVLDTGIIIAQNSFHYTYKGLPELYEHKIFPRDFWMHSDVILYFIHLQAISIHFNLITDQMMNSKLFIYQKWDKKGGSLKMYQYGRVLELKLAESIFQFRRVAIKLLRFVMFSAWTEMDSDFLLALWGNWSHSLRDYVFLIYCPVFFFYAANANLFMILYFAMSTRYIHYKQKYLLSKVKPLLLKLQWQIEKHYSVKLFVWYQLTAFNNEYCQLLREIKGLNRFWSKYLAIYFIVYIVHSTFMIYSLIFEPSDLGFAARKFFLFFGTQIGTVLLLINFECSDIVAKNLAIFKEQRKCCITFRQFCTLKIGDLLKIDEIEANHRSIAKTGFSLLDVIRINSRIFEMIFYFVSVTFMLLFRNQHYNGQKH